MHRFITPQRTNVNNNVHHNFLSAVQNKSSLFNKMSTIAPTLYFPKVRPFQLSRRVKDYLHQVTALHSLLLRYWLSNSSFIVRPRTQSLRFADTRPKRRPVHNPRRIKSPRFGWGLLLYTRVLRSLIGWHLARSFSPAQIWYRKARSGLATGALARVCPDRASSLTRPRIVRTLTVLIRESSTVIGSLPSRQHRLNWLMATEYSPASQLSAYFPIDLRIDRSIDLPKC